MRLVNIDDCNRALFYKQCGGKDSLITIESAFNMFEALPTAYDIDKVVKELEKELSLADKEKERCTGKNHLQFDSAKGYASGISTAIEIVKQEAEKFGTDINVVSNGWIPCSERLPEAGKRYLVSAIWKDKDFEKSAVYDAVYGSDGLWHSYNYEPVSYKIIAWKPLPEPFKGRD